MNNFILISSIYLIQDLIMRQRQLNPIKKSTESRNNHHLLEFRNEFITPSKRSEPVHALSELKPRANVIKINKAKLPADFFPKCFSFEKKLPHFKLNINELNKEMITPKPRRVESERLHISPQKTSFFGFFQPESHPQRNPQSRTLAVKRKFQTRQQPKRDNSQMKRRFTPGSNLHRNDLLDLFPATYDQQMTQIITSNSSARISKLSPRKEYQSKYQELAHQTDQNEDQSFNTSRKMQSSVGGLRNVINLRTVEREDDKIREELSFVKSETVDLHNMTFFNAKSSCLPPIKKI